MKIKFIAMMAAALVAAGCHNSMNSVQNAQQVGQRTMISDQRVISDTGLARKVGVVGLNTVTTPGGFLKVQVELLNQTRSLQTFNYRFEWFDQNGMQISAPAGAAIAGELDGGESKFISAVAPTEAAKDFRLKLILGK